MQVASHCRVHSQHAVRQNTLCRRQDTRYLTSKGILCIDIRIKELMRALMMLAFRPPYSFVYKSQLLNKKIVAFFNTTLKRKKRRKKGSHTTHGVGPYEFPGYIQNSVKKLNTCTWSRGLNTYWGSCLPTTSIPSGTRSHPDLSNRNHNEAFVKLTNIHCNHSNRQCWNDQFWYAHFSPVKQLGSKHFKDQFFLFFCSFTPFLESGGFTTGQ